MDMKLFLSTFILIFLAELGDKTQLAAMAQSAGAKSPWAVFLGASVALVLSTLVAVLVGSNLEKFINPKYIRLGAGILFLIFGVLLVVEVLRAKPEEAKEEPAMPSVQPTMVVSASGVLAHVAMHFAAEFEQASHEDYLALAAKATDPAHATLFRTLAQEEANHKAVLEGISLQELDTEAVGLAQEPLKDALIHDVALKDDPDFLHALEHEEATAKFYEELGQNMKIPSVRSALLKLAGEERAHAQKLRSMISA